MKPIFSNKADFLEIPDVTGIPDVAKIAESLLQKGYTPYIFVLKGLKCLVDSSYAEARKYMAFAMEFRGLFFEAGSPEDREYCVEMQLLNAAFLFLAEKFKDLPADPDAGWIKGLGREHDRADMESDACSAKEKDTFLSSMFPAFGREEARLVGAIMRSTGGTPYMYVYLAYDLLAAGCTSKAVDALLFADRFCGVFFPEGSREDDNYREAIGVLKHIIEQYPDKY